MHTVYAILSMLLFGVAVFFYKQGTTTFSTGLGATVFVASHLIILGTLAFIEKTKFNGKGFNFLLIAGILGGFAQVCFFMALKSGKLNTVVPIRNMALIVTIILGVIFLAEKLTLTKIIGIILGLLAVVLVSL